MKTRDKSYIAISKYASLLSYLIFLIFVVVTPGVANYLSLPSISAETRQIGIVSTAVAGIMLQLMSYREYFEIKLQEGKTEPEVRYIGSGDKATNELVLKVRTARNISNTFIGIRGGDPERIGKVYENWLNNPRAMEWIDIVGPAEIFDQRYKIIDPDIRKIFGNHSIYILRHSTPIINFIIIDYAEIDGRQEDSEVYFGWISTQRESQRIFSSKDQIVVNSFRSYFLTLKSHRTWGNPVHVDYNSAKRENRVLRSDLVDKVGCWTTLSYSQSGVETFGFFQIRINKMATEARKAGSMGIDGIILDSNGKIIGNIMHRDSHISHYKNKIFIEYGDEFGENRGGFCFYEFKKIGINNSKASRDIVDGFFLDEGKWSKNSIFGIKLLKDMNFLDEKNHLTMTKDILEKSINEGRISREFAKKIYENMPALKNFT